MSKKKQLAQDDWFLTSEKEPPEYSFLRGQNVRGDEFQFHCSRLECGALYFGTDLHPIQTPVKWKFAAAKSTTSPKEDSK